MTNLTIQLPLGMRDGQVVAVTAPALVILRPLGHPSEAEYEYLREQLKRMALPDGIELMIVENCDVMAVHVDQGADTK